MDHFRAISRALGLDLAILKALALFRPILGGHSRHLSRFRPILAAMAWMAWTLVLLSVCLSVTNLMAEWTDIQKLEFLLGGQVEGYLDQFFNERFLKTLFLNTMLFNTILCKID